MRDEMEKKRKIESNAYQLKYHCSEKQIQRRKVTQLVSNHLLGREESKSRKHKTEIMKSTTTVRSFEKEQQKKKEKKKRKCSNCGGEDHTLSMCNEPIREKKTRKNTNAISTDDVLQMFI